MFRNTYCSTAEQVSNPFNIGNVRNINNTRKRSYNCAGYALGTYSWYCPRHNASSSRAYSFKRSSTDKRHLAISVKTMLADFPDMRVITSISELMPDEYAIAFRHSSDGDFHFAKRGRNGVWYNKAGGSHWIGILRKEYLNGIWNGRYNGEIVLFAKKLPLDNK